MEKIDVPDQIAEEIKSESKKQGKGVKTPTKKQIKDRKKAQGKSHEATEVPP